VQDAAGAVILGAALTIKLAGALGQLRFPDLYTRLHALKLADELGAGLFVFGLIMMAPDAGTTLRLTLLGILVVAIQPLLAHLSASAAHHGGLAPNVGSHAPSDSGRRA
jgi:multicomponent Na+:H+ antiporter subunit G